MMTTEQAHRLRVLIQEAFELTLAKPIAFVLVAQDEERSLEIVTNAARRDQLPELLMAAAEITRTPPDGTIAIPDHRATGESADGSAQASGMECGHAAPQAPAVTGNAPGPHQGTEQPAAPAVSHDTVERCWRRIAPAFTEQCPNDATGGIRMKLYPALAVQRRYGKRDLLALLLDLPVCPGCFAQMTPLEVLSNQPPEMWGAFSKMVQKRNHGILPIKEQSEIEHLPFDDPEYVLLRKSAAQQRAAKDGNG
jgi:hypothetical protein